MALRIHAADRCGWEGERRSSRVLVVQSFGFDLETCSGARGQLVVLVTLLLVLVEGRNVLVLLHWDQPGPLEACVSPLVCDRQDGWVLIGSLHLLCRETSLCIAMSAPVVASWILGS